MSFRSSFFEKFSFTKVVSIDLRNPTLYASKKWCYRHCWWSDLVCSVCCVYCVVCAVNSVLCLSVQLCAVQCTLLIFLSVLAYWANSSIMEISESSFLTSFRFFLTWRSLMLWWYKTWKPSKEKRPFLFALYILHYFPDTHKIVKIRK